MALKRVVVHFLFDALWNDSVIFFLSPIHNIVNMHTISNHLAFSPISSIHCIELPFGVDTLDKTGQILENSFPGHD